MEMIRGAGGDQVKDMIGRRVGVDLDAAVAVIAQSAPGGQAGFEAAILQHFDGGGGRGLGHLKVIDETLAGVEQPQDELIPLRGAELICGNAAVGVVAPA
jgi:hypothetical protein